MCHTQLGAPRIVGGVICVKKDRRSLSSLLLISILLTERNDRVEYVFVFVKLVDASCITWCHVVGGP